MALKRDALDALFSNYIRERDNWTCQRCQKYYPEGDRQGLDCAHIFSRRHKGLRWDGSNAVALCYGCHSFFTGHPLYFFTWVAQKMGQQKFNLLRARAVKPTKYTKFDLEQIRNGLKVSLKELRAERKNKFHVEAS